MPVAFKEWAVTVRALAEGEQLLTLRKGGIREENRHFEIEHDRFFLYPTFDHQRNDLVKDAHQPELPRALEEGVWSDGEPSPRGFSRDGGIPQPDRVRIRAWAEVAASYLITDPRCVDALSPYYVWSDEYMAQRLRWKPRHPLHVILLRTYRIPRPVTVKVRDEYVGCHSWLELHRELPFEGTPVLSDDEFARVEARGIGNACGIDPSAGKGRLLRNKSPRNQAAADNDAFRHVAKPSGNVADRHHSGVKAFSKGMGALPA